MVCEREGADPYHIYCAESDRVLCRRSFSPRRLVISSLFAFPVTLLAGPSPFSESSTVLGWLPAETPGEDHGAGLNDFVQNPRFLPLLHEAISSGLAEAVDDIQASGALQLGDGWMHIHDDRNLPPLNRIGDPDDILASVRVQGGKILAETYQAMPSYRVCTAHGITQLTEGLASKLQTLLDTRARDEGLRNPR